MSNRKEREAEDAYETQNDPSPISGDFSDNSYATEQPSSLKGQVPVQRDEESYEDPVQPPFSNTDQQLEAQDEREAIDKSNILKGDRLRHAKPQAQGYTEGEDEDEFQ